MTDDDNRTDGWQLETDAPVAYERYLVPEMFAPWAAHLLERSGVGRGDRLLDVGCGTGVVARQAAPRVGGDGVVVGLDLNEGMLEVADASASEAALSVEWYRGDATALPFPDETFDAVCCQQAMQFVSDPTLALGEMNQVLRPGGRLAVSVWRPIEFHPTYVAMAEALERHVGAGAAAMMRSPFPAWDRSTLREFVSDAGFRDVVLTIEGGTVRYPSTEEYLRREAASSPLAGPVGGLGPDVRDALLEELDDSLAAYLDDHGVFCPMETYVVDARR